MSLNDRLHCLSYRLHEKVSALISSSALEGHPELLQAIQELTFSLLESAAQEMAVQLERLLGWEQQDPFTHQQALQEAVNGVRCGGFDAVLRKVLESMDVRAAGGDPNSLREEFKTSLGPHDKFLLCFEK